MKHILFIIFLLNHIIVLCQDKQWYIWNEEIKLNHRGDFPPCNNLGLSIQGIHPLPLEESDRGGGKPTRDLFIIFKDGTFFNSYKRYPYTELLRNLLNSDTYNLKYNSEIKFLYHTFVYDDNDVPPRLVSCRNPNDSDVLISPSAHDGRGIEINHTPVIGKDITYIIKYDGDEGKVKYNTYYYEYDSIFFQSANKQYEARNNRTIGEITINHLEIYGNPIFLNFRVKKNIAADSIGNFIKLSFNNGETERELTTKLLDAHDPNFITQCIDISSMMANYHIEFENTGFNKTNNVSVNFAIPEILSENGACIKEMMLGNKYYKLDQRNFQIENKRFVKVNFLKDDILNKHEIGYIDICFKIDTAKIKNMGISYFGLDSILKLSDARTTFNDKYPPYRITKHYGICNDMRDVYEYPKIKLTTRLGKQKSKKKKNEVEKFIKTVYFNQEKCCREIYSKKPDCKELFTNRIYSCNSCCNRIGDILKEWWKDNEIKILKDPRF